MTTRGLLCPSIPRQVTWLLKLVTVLLVFGLGSTAMGQTTQSTIAFYSCYDLETGEVASEGAPSQCQPHGDIIWACNADTTVHARLSWNAEYVDVAFVAKAYDDVTDADISQSYFCESVDDENAGCQDADPHFALGDERSAILLTGDGNYFKVGFISESDNDGVVFEYELLITGPARSSHSSDPGDAPPAGDSSGDLEGAAGGPDPGDAGGGTDPGETLPLIINCPPDLVITCEDSIDAVNAAGGATADGGCPGTIDIIHTDGETGPGLGFCGTLLRTWTATDECFISEFCVQTITITGVDPPAFSCPPDVTLDCAIEETAGLYADPGTGTTGYPDYTSSCGTSEVTFADVTTLADTCLTGIERTWTVTDSCGYSATCLQTISVNDVDAPIVDCPPDIIISCEDSSDPDYTGYASVSDNCYYDPVIYYDISDPANGCHYPDNFITRRWLGTDKCGNEGTCLQQITRIDPYLSYWWPANGATDVRPETRLEFSINRAPTAMQIVPGNAGTYSEEYEGREGLDEEQVTYDLFVGQGTVTIEEFLDALNHLHADQPEKIQFRANGNMVFQDGGSPILLFDMDQNNSVTVTGIEEELFDNGITYNPTGEPAYDAAQARKNFPILGVTWYGAVYYCNWLTKRKKRSNERAYAIGSHPDDWRPASLTKAEWQDGFGPGERENWIQQYPVSYRLPMDDYAEAASRYNEFFHFVGDFGEDGENADEMNYWNSGDFFDNGPVPPDYYDDNEFGLQNVLGNVWEWQTDTFAPQDLSARSLRGISWYNNPQLLDRLERIAADPESGFADVGFRVVSSVDVVFEVEIAENAEFTDSTVLTMSAEVPALNGYYTKRSRELSLTPSTDYFWRVRASHSRSGELDSVDLLFGAPQDSPMPYVTFRTSDQVREPTLQLNLAGEWNLVSINVDPDPNVAHPKHLFGMDSTAWGWDSEQQIYFRLYEIKPFEGFWIHVPEPGTVEVTGLTPDPEIEIRHGWNLLGPLNDGTSIPTPSKLRGEVLQYLNGGYESADALHTGSGYWMFFIADFVHDLSGGEGEEEAEY